MTASKATNSVPTTQANRRWRTAVIAAVSSLACLLIIVAVVGAWPAFPDLLSVLIAISLLAASVGTLLRSVTWYLVALIGAAIGCVSAFIYAAYAMSRI
jgi:hypothetical protein